MKKEYQCIVAWILTGEMTAQKPVKYDMLHSAPTLKQEVMKGVDCVHRTQNAPQQICQHFLSRLKYIVALMVIRENTELK